MLVSMGSGAFMDNTSAGYNVAAFELFGTLIDTMTVVKEVLN